MTVRLLLTEAAETPSRKQRGLRIAEYLFLFLGLIALDYYVWVKAGATLSQAYESWAFNERLEGRGVSITRFLEDEFATLTGRPTTNSPSIAPPSGTASLDRTRSSVPIAPLEPLAVVGRIEIPRLRLTAMVREGVTDRALREAVGHIPSSALPGQRGNVALAAHRDTFFRPLEGIRKDDRILVQTLQGSHEYVVDSIRIVKPKDVWVLNAADKPTLTLVTCYPFHYIGAAPNRFIVRATEVAGSARPNEYFAASAATAATATAGTATGALGTSGHQRTSKVRHHRLHTRTVAYARGR